MMRAGGEGGSGSRERGAAVATAAADRGVYISGGGAVARGGEWCAAGGSEALGLTKSEQQK